MTDDDHPPVDPAAPHDCSLAGELKHAFTIWRRSPNPDKDTTEVQWSQWGNPLLKRVRVPPGIIELSRCTECGYPLHGLPDDARCPECGISRDEALEAMKARTQIRIRELIVAAGSICGLVIAVEFGLPLPIVAWNCLPVLAAFAITRSAIKSYDGRWLRIPVSGFAMLLAGLLLPIMVIVIAHLYWLATSGIATVEHPDGVLLFFVLPFIAALIGIIGAPIGFGSAVLGATIYRLTTGVPESQEATHIDAPNPEITVQHAPCNDVAVALVKEDEALLAQFEATTWPIAQWHHREHVKIAYLYLRRYRFDIAIEKMRRGIKAYNAANKVPESQTAGYHETMTQAFMRLISMTLSQFGPSESADAFVDKHTQLLSKRALLFFYSRDHIMSLEAKSRFVEPDLAPLPQSRRIDNADAVQSRKPSRKAEEPAK